MSRTLNIEQIYLDAPYDGLWPGPESLDVYTAPDGGSVNPPTGTAVWRLMDYQDSVSAEMGVTASELSTLLQVQIDLSMDIESLETDVSPLDLMPLVPLKFHSAQAMQDLIYGMNNSTAVWLAQIKALQSIVNPYQCPDPLLRALASNIGITFNGSNSSPVNRQIIQDAPDLFRYKGSNDGVKYLLNGDYMRLREGWTLSTSSYDTGTFQYVDWDITTGAGVPDGVTAGSYKTPHTLIYCRLNEFVTVSGVDYLLHSDEATRLLPYQTEYAKVRPITVVPHWGVMVSGYTGAYGQPLVDGVSGQVSGWCSDTNHTTWLSSDLYSVVSDTDNAGVAFGNGAVEPDDLADFSSWTLTTPTTGVKAKVSDLPDRYVVYVEVAYNAALPITPKQIGVWSSAHPGSTSPVLWMSFPLVSRSANLFPIRFEWVIKKTGIIV